MFFNSIEFVIFLPIVFVLYWYVFGKSSKTQNAFLLFASYVFYAFADYRFLALLAFTTLCTYYSARAINKHKEQGEQKKAKAMSALNIVANLLVLGFFKYYNFFVSSFAAILPGVNADSLMLNIVLPLGISYYTFTALSYSIDVYWGKTKATHDIVQVATYISFFPQLLAGPIGRSTYLLEQYNSKRTFNYAESVDGLRQILWGLFKKIIVADNCAEYVNGIWGNILQQSRLDLIIVLILTAFQIYGDFSGYSDIATGVAKLFGIRLKQNFKYPFFSTNVIDFWSRWHISLTSWLRDYIYAPLGGIWSKATIIRNIFIVFTICGLWHGASWNHITWGLYNALLFIPPVLCYRYYKPQRKRAKSDLFLLIKKILSCILTDVFLLLGLILIFSESLGQAMDYLLNIFGNNTINATFENGELFILLKRVIVILLMIFVEWINRHEEHGLSFLKTHSPIFRYCIYYMLTLMIIVFGIQAQPFVYSQF